MKINFGKTHTNIYVTFLGGITSPPEKDFNSQPLDSKVITWDLQWSKT